MDFEQPLPSNDQAERFALGAAMNDPDAWPVLQELLEVDDFFLDKHRTLFEAMGSLYRQGLTIDISKVALELEKVGKRDKVGGLMYLYDLASIAKLTNLDFYCLEIKKASVRRQVIVEATNLVSRCFDADADTTDVERIREVLLKSTKRSGARSWEEIVFDEGGINAFMSPQTQPGIHIPFQELHETLDGLRRQCLIILGARPGIGKTAAALQIAEHAALIGKTVLFVSLEMGARRLIHRAITGRAQVSSYKFRRGILNPGEKKAVNQAAGHLAALENRMLYSDSAGMTVQGLEALMRAQEARGRHIDLVVVDYLQLLKAAGRFENRVQEVSVITRCLKEITMHYDVPVLALSQLSRKGEDTLREPQLDWLRESGTLEQDADQIIFMWPKSQDDKDNDSRRICWKVAKNRDGAENWGEFAFQGKYCRFVEDEPEREEEVA